VADLFTAIADRHRRDILDTLLEGEMAVGALVSHLSLAQPQVSKHLRVLSGVGLVRSRPDGRRRLYSVDPTRLGPFRDWLAKYEQAMSDRLDRIDKYLMELQEQEQGGTQ
jgi:DNA-binding transcriptional ArsR family regulator